MNAVAAVVDTREVVDKAIVRAVETGAAVDSGLVATAVVVAEAADAGINRQLS